MNAYPNTNRLGHVNTGGKEILPGNICAMWVHGKAASTTHLQVHTHVRAYSGEFCECVCTTGPVLEAPKVARCLGSPPFGEQMSCERSFVGRS